MVSVEGGTAKPPSESAQVKFFLLDPLTAMKKRSAIMTDQFADEQHKQKIDQLGDPLAGIELHICFATLTAEVDRIAPRPVSP